MLVSAVLSACATDAVSPNRVQFSKATAPYPEAYLEDAARVVTERNGDFAVVRASAPRTTTGSNPMAPQRWYVCISGLPAATALPLFANADTAIASLFNAKATAGVFYVVLFFGNYGGRPSVRAGFDSPLCHDGAYGPVPAPDDLT